MSLYTKNNALVIKNNKLASAQACCAACSGGVCCVPQPGSFCPGSPTGGVEFDCYEGFTKYDCERCDEGGLCGVWKSGVTSCTNEFSYLGHSGASCYTYSWICDRDAGVIVDRNECPVYDSTYTRFSSYEAAVAACQQKWLCDPFDHCINESWACSPACNPNGNFQINHGEVASCDQCVPNFCCIHGCSFCGFTTAPPPDFPDGTCNNQCPENIFP